MLLTDLYLIHKGIMHNEIKLIKGSEIESWQNTAQVFLDEMTRIIDNLIESRK